MVRGGRIGMSMNKYHLEGQGDLGIMEKKMETTIRGLGFRGT